MKIKTLSLIMLSILTFNAVAEENQRSFVFGIPNKTKSFVVDNSTNVEEPEQWIQIEDKIVKQPIYPLSSVTFPTGAANYLNYPNSGTYPVNLTYTGNIRYYTIKQEQNNKTNEIRELPPIETIVTETNIFPSTFKIEHITDWQFQDGLSYYGNISYNNTRDENGNIVTTQPYYKIFTKIANIDRFSSPMQLRNNLNARLVQNNITLQKTETEIITKTIPNSSGFNCNYLLYNYVVMHSVTFMDYKDPNSEDHYTEFLTVYYNDIGFSFVSRNVFSESELMTESEILNLIMPFNGKEYKASNSYMEYLNKNTIQDYPSYISTYSRKTYSVCQSI